MEKCKICGEPTHSAETWHLSKSQIYKLIAKNIKLADRSLFSGEELADFLASYFGRRVILVEKRAHKVGWFSSVPATMLYDAWPKPAKIVEPNGIVTWMTDREDNLPDDAPEYKVRKTSTKITGGRACTECGTNITFDSLEEKNIRCPDCGKRYKVVVDDCELIRLWETKELVDTQVKMHLEEI